jgi:hypothetical protein
MAVNTVPHKSSICYGMHMHTLLLWITVLWKVCFDEILISMPQLAQEPKCLATGASDGSISIFDIESGARKLSMSE